MPGKPWIISVAFMLPLSAAAIAKTPLPDMDLIEFLGNLDTKDDSGKEFLTAMEINLLPELPEEPSYDNCK